MTTKSVKSKCDECKHNRPSIENSFKYNLTIVNLFLIHSDTNHIILEQSYIYIGDLTSEC